jgi:hypothetical protein
VERSASVVRQPIRGGCLPDGLKMNSAQMKSTEIKMLWKLEAYPLETNRQQRNLTNVSFLIHCLTDES